MNNKSDKWEFHNPMFTFHKDYMDFFSPWAGHIHFAFDLIANLQPKTVVELGTYKGTSFFSFCEAVKELKLGTILYAIDTWKGDSQTGFYDDTVFDFFGSIQKKYFSEVSARFVRKDFNNAITDFADKSIDILHIDGDHTFDAVKNDYLKWRGKVSPNGVILFHDTKVGSYGVWNVWEELVKKEEKEATFLEFKHSNGLGAVFRSAVQFDPDLLINFYREKDQFFKSLFAEIKRTKEFLKSLEQLAVNLKEKKKNLENDINVYAKKAKSLENDVNAYAKKEKSLNKEIYELSLKNLKLVKENTALYGKIVNSKTKKL